jgi:hypothetical protein
MRILLACLMCEILIASQCFAIKGGPVYTNRENIVGSYAGVLDPDPASPGAENTIGIFTIGIPQVGLANGAFLVFTGERTFVGSIQGVGDPIKASLSATMQGIPVVTAGNTTIFTLNFHADGRLKATVKTRSSGIITSIANTRLTGTAHVTTTNRNVDPPEQTMTDFTVDGFKQSLSATGGTAGSSATPTGG